MVATTAADVDRGGIAADVSRAEVVGRGYRLQKLGRVEVLMLPRQGGSICRQHLGREICREWNVVRLG